MAWRRKQRGSAAGAEQPPLLDPDPLRTPDDAFETRFLIGALQNVWQSVVVKNLKDRRIATGNEPSDGGGPAGHVAGQVAGHRAGEE